MTGLTFDPERHEYFFHGVKVWRSVTGVLQHAGAIDFSGIPTFVLDRARERGSTVHQAIHYLNEGDLNVLEFRSDFPDYTGYLDAWISFRHQRRFVPVLNEHRIYSRRHDVAGTIDCLGWIDGHQAALLDFATGRPEDVAKHWQTAGYLSIAMEWAPDDPDIAAFLASAKACGVKRFAVALRRDGTFQIEPYAAPRELREWETLVQAQRLVAIRKREPVEDAA
jgi:hypothetical protein